MQHLSLIFWGESFLSIVLWGEILCLVAALILKYVGNAAVKRNPDDYVYHFAKVWWATFRMTPSPIKAPKMIDVEGDDKERGPLMDLIDEDAIAELGRAMPEEDDARGRGGDEDEEEQEAAGGGGGGGGMRVATLQVRVIPQQGADEVVGFVGKTLKIRVTAGEEGGQANKAVIELLASTLGLRTHQVQLRRGHYEDQKVLSIAGLTQAELDERLSAFS